MFAKSCETRSIGYWNGVLALPAIIHWHLDDHSMANTPQRVMGNTNWSPTFTPRLKVCTRHSVRAMCGGVLWGLTLTIFLYSWAWVNNIISRCQWSKPAECGWIGHMHMTPLITDNETKIKQRKTNNTHTYPQTVMTRANGVHTLLQYISISEDILNWMSVSKREQPLFDLK